MNEQIKFLREHIKDICSYKGLQQELTYDISVDILKRVCLALDFLQQENQQLKDILDELEKWLDNFHESSGFQVWEIKNKIKELRGSNNE